MSSYQSLILTKEDFHALKSQGFRIEWPNPTRVAHEQKMARHQAERERMHKRQAEAREAMEGGSDVAL